VPTPSRRIWQQRLFSVVYESDTPAGKAFDVGLLIAIVSSIVVVMLDSIQRYHERHGALFFHLEWGFTILFSIEFTLRLICVKRPLQYVFSPLGIIDLLAIIPSFLSIIYAGAQTLLAFRALRLLRIFRIFKLTRFLTEAQYLTAALRSSLRKIAIFMLTVITLVLILGSIMYLVERRENGFTSIPESIYWAIVTITTVGYGDISPVTPLGKFVASIMMLIGYGIIAVPTGIITTEISRAVRDQHRQGERKCSNCRRSGMNKDAKFCQFCGEGFERLQ
jgi:voltage-gated potassium channel